MKYQIILESKEIIPDDEFRYQISQLLGHSETCDDLVANDYSIVEARSLDGIREEVYKKREEIIDGILHAKEPSEVVEHAFEDLNDLFKLD